MSGGSTPKKRVPGTRILRDRTYEVVRVVPPDCVSLVGKKNLTRRLNTTKFSEASKLAPPVLLEFDEIIRAARAGLAPSKLSQQSVDPRLAVRAIERWRSEELSRAEHRAFNESDDMPDETAPFAVRRDFVIRYHELRDPLRRTGGWVHMPNFDDRLLEALASQGFVLPASHPAMDRLRPIFQSAWRDVVKYEDDLRAGVVTPGELPPSSYSTTLPPENALSDDSPTILETFERWKVEHLRVGGPTKTIAEFETQVRRFVDFRGNKRVRDVSKKDVIAFKDAMLNYPARRNAEVAGKDLAAIIEWGMANDVPKLSSKTVNEKVLASLRAVFAYAVSRDEIEVNPVGGVRVKLPVDQQPPRLPYNSDELSALFSSPVFATGYRTRGGKGEAAKWIPLLALFTGARLEEIAIAETSDVKREAGITYIHFQTMNDDGTRRRVKNKFSRRKVPIHSTLISLGFTDYVEAQKKAGKVRLFSEVSSAVEKASAAYSKWYGRYARKYVPDTKKSFHSFRHTFKRALRNGGVEKTLRDAVMGHTAKDEAERYGLDEDGQGFAIQHLRDAVEAAKYASIDFARIR